MQPRKRYQSKCSLTDETYSKQGTASTRTHNDVKHILALDQGTTSSRAIVFAEDGSVRAQAQQEFRQIFPQPGWGEHDPEDIWASQLSVARRALSQARLKASDITAIGISNQRETAIVW